MRVGRDATWRYEDVLLYMKCFILVPAGGPNDAADPDDDTCQCEYSLWDCS